MVDVAFNMLNKHERLSNPLRLFEWNESTHSILQNLPQNNQVIFYTNQVQHVDLHKEQEIQEQEDMEEVIGN